MLITEKSEYHGNLVGNLHGSVPTAHGRPAPPPLGGSKSRKNLKNYQENSGNKQMPQVMPNHMENKVETNERLTWSGSTDCVKNMNPKYFMRLK